MEARNNPFRSARLDALAYRPPDGVDAFAQLARGRFRGLVAGPKGSGKTTLFEQVRARFEGQGTPVAHLRLTSDDSARRTFSLTRWMRAQDPAALWLLDGAEQLSWPDRLRLRRSLGLPGPGFLLTAHRPLAGIPLLLQTRATPGLLDELLRELDPAWSAPSADELFARHRGNLRLALLEAYECHSRQ